ncbi:hypothetical protein AB0N20_35785, partial [Streptomyces griseoincarnatus]
SALDNAAAESFNSLLKVEYIHRHRFATRTEARPEDRHLDHRVLQPATQAQRGRRPATDRVRTDHHGSTQEERPEVPGRIREVSTKPGD